MPALRLHRIAYLGCAIGALACGRTTASSVLEISAVTTTTSHASPGQTIDVDVHLHNHGSSRLELVTDELSMLPEQESFIYVPAAGNTDTLSPGAQTLRYRVVLPVYYQQLIVDAAVVAIDPVGSRAHRARGAVAPLVIDSTPYLPEDTDLVVTVVVDELDGATDIAAAGGAGDLSLREAVGIANSRPGPDAIQFDAGIFAVNAPGVIEYDSSLGSIVLEDAGTSIDARERGVILRGAASGPPLRIHSNNCAVVGMSIRDFERYAIWTENAGSALLEDNVLDMGTTYHVEAVFKINSSPGFRAINNVILNGRSIFWILNTENVVIADNTIQDATSTAITIEHVDNVVVAGNDIIAPYTAIIARYTTNATIINNRIVGTEGHCVAMHSESSDGLIADNVLRNCGAIGAATGDAVSLSSTAVDISVRRTTMENPGNGLIVLPVGGNRGVVPPTIVAVGSTTTGTSTQPEGSIVELFTSPTNGADRFVGEGTVDASGNWSVVSSVALVAGETVSATVTEPNGSTSELTVPVVVP